MSDRSSSPRPPSITGIHHFIRMIAQNSKDSSFSSDLQPKPSSGLKHHKEPKNLKRTRYQFIFKKKKDQNTYSKKRGAFTKLPVIKISSLHFFLTALKASQALSSLSTQTPNAPTKQIWRNSSHKNTSDLLKRKEIHRRWTLSKLFVFRNP